MLNEFDSKEELKDSGLNFGNIFEITEKEKAKILVLAELEKAASAVNWESISFNEGRACLLGIFNNLNDLVPRSPGRDSIHRKGIVFQEMIMLPTYLKGIYNYIMLKHEDMGDLIRMMSEVVLDFWDINGSRAISHFFGYTLSKLYFANCALVLINNEKRSEYLRDGLFSIFLCQGDEFCELLLGEFPERASYLGFVNNEIEKMDTRIIFDPQEATGILEKLNKANIVVPENASLIASLSRGTASLADTFLQSITKLTTELLRLAGNNKNIYEARRDFALRRFISDAESSCNVDKEEYYTRMQLSNDPNLRFQAHLRKVVQN